MNKIEAIKQFQEITGCNEQESKFYLEAGSWDVQLSYSMFSNDHQKPTTTPQEKPVISSVKSQPLKRNTGVKRIFRS